MMDLNSGRLTFRGGMRLRRYEFQLLCLGISLMASCLFAQATAHPVATASYDVVSIVPDSAGETAEMGLESHDGVFQGRNVDLKNLLINAYDIKPDLIYGLPGWASSTRWDVNAKISDPDPVALKDLSKDQRRAMLAQVLIDRFHLKSHFETKQLPVYKLVVLPNGPKFKPSAKQSDKDMQGMSSGPSEITLQAYPLSALTFALTGILHRPVVDETGLTAHYDLHLTFSPEQSGESQDNGSNEDNGPSIFTATQEQLGLKLVPSRGPVPVLMIDKVNLPPPN